MNFERTPYGVLIGETYLSPCQALDLLQWLAEQRDALQRAHPEQFRVFIERQFPTSQRQQPEWSQADEEEMKSEDEQIACFDL
jgi:hypothetical protein